MLQPFGPARHPSLPIGWGGELALPASCRGAQDAVARAAAPRLGTSPLAWAMPTCGSAGRSLWALNTLSWTYTRLWNTDGTGLREIQPPRRRPFRRLRVDALHLLAWLCHSSAQQA